MSVYVLSSDADRDLDDIWEYIAQDSVDAAERWIAKLAQREDLTQFPVLLFPVGS